MPGAAGGVVAEGARPDKFGTLGGVAGLGADATVALRVRAKTDRPTTHATMPSKPNATSNAATTVGVARPEAGSRPTRGSGPGEALGGSPPTGVTLEAYQALATLAAEPEDQTGWRRLAQTANAKSLAKGGRLWRLLCGTLCAHKGARP